MKRKKQNEKHANEELVASGRHFEGETSPAFESDILISEEYDRVYRKRILSPEEQLMVAVLEEAVADFKRYAFVYDKKGRKRFVEAQAWILDDSQDWIFSFANCCGVMGIEPHYMCGGLLRWKRTKAAQPRAVGPRHKPHKRPFRAAA